MGSLSQVFVECQRTTASHPKLMKQLIGLYKKSDLDGFVLNFTNLLKKSLIHGDKQPAVERTLNFVAKFATMKKAEESKESAEKEEKEDDEEDTEEADIFLVRLIEFLLNNHEASSQAVRFRVCQLINKILNQMGEEAVIDDDLYSSIYDTMLQRLQDKVPSVRVQAVLAVARLQDPRNKECPVIKAYRYHLCMDPNPDVRRAVLGSTAITFQTLPDVLERTRDVNDSVRKEAFKVLSQKVHIRSLTIAQRVRLISEGLKDRSNSVRSAVEKGLLQSWLRMVNGNVLDFLSCLDVEASVSEAELALNTLFMDVPFADLVENFGLDKEERLVEINSLKPESTLYWRCLAQHLRNEGQEEALDTIIPELTKFCIYVHDYAMAELKGSEDSQEVAVLRMEREFVTQQLMMMTMLYDLADEVGRRSLDKLVRTLLMSDHIADSLVKDLVEVFGKLHPPTTRVNQLAEITSDIREPATKTVILQPISDEERRKKKIQAARIRVRMNQVREEMEDSVKNLDFEKAQVLKEELEELETELSLINLEEETVEDTPVQEERTDPTTLSKCLKIICHMLENPDITTMTPTLYSINENLILPCLRSEDPAVRNGGVKALGLLCLLSPELSKQHLVLFLQISRIDVEQIQLTALHCVIDLLLLYGLEEFTEAAEDINEVNGELNTSSKKKPSENEDEDEEEEEEGGVIISALCQMMESENSEVRTQVAEGLCKLLLACRITSSKLLSHLILMWYNPTTEDDSLLRHMLGVFFPLYASYGGSNQESLCAAVLPTLHTLFNAPARSPLAEVDVNDVANFLVSITNPSFASADASEQVNTHDTLVFSLCTEILANPDNYWAKVLCRCLTHLNLTPTNYSTLRQVKVLCEKMLQRVRVQVCQNALERFSTTVQGFLKNAPEPEPEPEVEEENNEENPDGSVFSASTSVIETTVIRKKRALYNQTHSDLELYSSEAESDGERTPVKKLVPDPSKGLEMDEVSTFGSPKITSTQKDDDEAEEAGNKETEETEGRRKDVIGEVENTEVELSPIVLEDLSIPANGSQKRMRKHRSPRSGQSSDEDVGSPSKLPRKSRQVLKHKYLNKSEPSKRHHEKQQSSQSQESSEGEAAVPPKVPRTSGSSDTLQDDSADSSESEVSVPTSSKSTSDDSSAKEKASSSSLYETPPTRSRSARISKGSSSDAATPVGMSSHKKAAEVPQGTPASGSEKNDEKDSVTPVRMSSRKKVAEVPKGTPGSGSEKNDEKDSVTPVGVSSRKKTAEVPQGTPGSGSQKNDEKDSVTPVRMSSRKKAAEVPEGTPGSGAEKNDEKESTSHKGMRSTRGSLLAKQNESTPPVKRSTRMSSSSQSANKTPSTSSVATDDSSPVVRRSNRKAMPSRSSQSSSSTQKSHKSSTEEDKTPVRGRGRGRPAVSSQSTDSESEISPDKGSVRRSSRQKGSKK